MQKGAKTVQKRNKGGEVSKTIYPTRNISATQDTGKSSGKVVAVSGHQMVPIRRPVPSTDQASQSCFYFRIS